MDLTEHGAWCQILVINFLVNESNVTNVNEIFSSVHT